MVTKRRLVIILVTMLLTTLFLILGVWFKFLYSSLITDEQGMRYTVREGTSIYAVINELHDLKVVNHPELFKYLVRMQGVAHELKAGEYLFPKGTTPIKLLHQITTGSGIIYYSFMIVPGWTFKDLRAALLRDPYLKHTTQNLSDAEIMQRLGHPELKPEGEFFPDTYFFIRSSDDILLLKRAFNAMQKKLNAAWEHREADLPFKSSYQALVAASIIEKEFYLHEELPKIAGVLVNRLKKDMLLQFDPTVIYGAGPRFDGKIRRTDLLSNNPYNTYVHKGLPPTPISMPSLAAIEAVMHPMHHDFYYFVAQNIGSHQFSKELNEHNKAVEEARKEKQFFNFSLVRFYLIKLFSQRIYSFS